MANLERDEVAILSDCHPQVSVEVLDSRFPRHVSRTRSVSISIPTTLTEPLERDTNIVGYTGPLRIQRITPFNQMSGPLHVTNRPGNLFWQNKVAPQSQAEESKTENFSSCCGILGENDLQNYACKNEHLVRSGPLGMCSDPYCTTCPTYFKAIQKSSSNASGIFNHEFRNTLCDDAKNWARRLFTFLIPHVPRVINPHNKLVQQWNQFFIICCLVAIFVDPSFFFLLSVQKNNKCIVIDWAFTKLLVALRSMNDFIHFLNIVLQIFILFVLPSHLGAGSAGANYANNLLRIVILVQHIPRLCRFLPMIFSPAGFVFESPWANFFINLFTFVLSGHVVGSWWYLFSLQRVNQCLREACDTTHIAGCTKFIDCGHGITEAYQHNNSWHNWRNNPVANACFTEDGFRDGYGIFIKAVNLTAHPNLSTRYFYSSFWGFQQISTLTGNLIPSYFVPEILFTKAILASGLLLFALLIGNIQNILQALGRR